jgi:hypothetical protein
LATTEPSLTGETREQEQSITDTKQTTNPDKLLDFIMTTPSAITALFGDFSYKVR